VSSLVSVSEKEAPHLLGALQKECHEMQSRAKTTFHQPSGHDLLTSRWDIKQYTYCVNNNIYCMAKITMVHRIAVMPRCHAQ
jgi:hypothetical protein